MSKPHVSGEVKQHNQRHHPAADHPFRTAFSPRRMQAPDCNARCAPCPPERLNGVPHPLAKESPPKADQPATVLWQMKPLPVDWSADERLFFENWRAELVRLHGTLTSVAAGQPKVLWRARKAYWMLCRELFGLAQTAESAHLKSRAAQSQDAAAWADRPTK